MEKELHQQIITRRIDDLITSVLPNGGGTHISETELRFLLDKIGQVAFAEGVTYGLTNILTADQVAESFGVSLRRAQALIRNRHERFGVGDKIGDTWVIHADELEALRPGTDGRPKKDRKAE